MAVPFIVFLRSIGLYLLFTLPAIAVPVIYVYSAFLAIVFGAAGGILFICCYFIISRLNISYPLKLNLLFFLILIGVSASYLLIGLFSITDDLWGFNFFLVFPAIALIAGWASLFISRKAIRQHLDHEADEIQLLLKP
jgi:hypothetical protein